MRPISMCSCVQYGECLHLCKTHFNVAYTIDNGVGWSLIVPSIHALNMKGETISLRMRSCYRPFPQFDRNLYSRVLYISMART